MPGKSGLERSVLKFRMMLSTTCRVSHTKLPVTRIKKLGFIPGLDLGTEEWTKDRIGVGKEDIWEDFQCALMRSGLTGENRTRALDRL